MQVKVMGAQLLVVCFSNKRVFHWHLFNKWLIYMNNIYSGFPRTLPVTFSETILSDAPLEVGLGAAAIMPSCMMLVPPWYWR